MTDFYSIERENMPCLYEIGWQKRTLALILKIHESIIQTCPDLRKSFWIAHFIKNFGFRFFDQFKADLFGDLYFGFDCVCRKVGEQNGFWIFEIPIPQIKKQINEACHYCNGTGEDKIIEQKCLACGGCGMETVMDWKKIEVISASLVIFFDIVSMRCEKGKESNCDFPQLILIETMLERKMHGGSLSGDYSLPLVNFLSSFAPNTEITEMKDAMVLAHRKMFGKKDKYEIYEMEAKVAYENGWLNTSCPGNACGLHPADSWGLQNGNGYRFSCHNVDTAAQQITLIAGLAALCDKYRKEVGNLQ